MACAEASEVKKTPIVTELKFSTRLDRGLVMKPLQTAFLTGDEEAHRFEVRCFRQNESVSLESATITGYFIRSDGVTLPIPGNVENNAAVVQLPAACYVRTGQFSLVVKAAIGGSISAILWAQGVISRSKTDDVRDPLEKVPSLDELLAQIDRLEQAINKAENVANLTAEATTLAAGSAATAEYKNGKLTLGIPKGADGQKGDPGYTPVKGKDYFDGAKGDPGYTPVKGKDYYTEAEKAEFVEEVLDAMPEGSGGGSLPTGGEPFKQLVTDGQGKIVWTDRLAYAETLVGVVLPETELIWVEDAGAFALVDQPETMPVVGVKHKVAYNGTTYECVGMPYDDGDVTQGVFLGNEGILSGDIDPTGPLFALIILSEEAAAEQGMWGILFALDGANSATVSVEINGENVKQIDRKFVPDSRFLVSVTGEDNIPSSYKADCTYEQLLDAYNAGRPLVCRFCNTVFSETSWNYYTHDSGPEGMVNGYIRFVRSVTGTDIEWIDISVDLDGNTVVTHKEHYYSLPRADKDVLGCVRVGNGLKIDEKTGVLSVDEDFIHTPVKGEDYWTPADQESVVQQVIAALGTPVFGRVEADKNIILTANNLAAGTYKLWIEDENGAHSKLCDYTHGGTGPSYTNLFNPDTATINTRMSASSSAAKAQDGYVMTARISVPSFIASGTLSDDAPYLAVPAGMWTGSANVFMGIGEAHGAAYVAADSTAGTTENGWTKIPLYNQWGGDKTIEYLTVSLYVKSSVLTTADIQNIQIYLNECPA